MEKKKRQHYVPQFYLRNFVREDNKFTIFNIKSEKIIENAPYRKQCYEDYYYGDDEVWEEKLGAIESSAALIIAKINKLGVIPLVKSKNEERIKSNFLNNIEISAELLSDIRILNDGIRVYRDPENNPYV